VQLKVLTLCVIIIALKLFFVNLLFSIFLQDLERKIADFHSREDAILYASCFDANAGIFEQLLGPDDAIISDELNHASIIDGIRLCKAKKFRYRHRNMQGFVYLFIQIKHFVKVL
jgi:7-keto-8-aminopelargonate synthetase-like enzyme